MKWIVVDHDLDADWMHFWDTGSSLFSAGFLFDEDMYSFVCGYYDCISLEKESNGAAPTEHFTPKLPLEFML